ncbi:MAG: hypothetical protein AAGF75_02885 [Cyanobacteria bacterium P01_H01_bin.130]
MTSAIWQGAVVDAIAVAGGVGSNLSLDRTRGEIETGAIADVVA